jgi:GTP cyclohydrolase I
VGNVFHNRKIMFDDTHIHRDNSMKDLTPINTPLHDEAFKFNDKEKIQIIENHFKAIMHTLGLDLSDDSLQNTPHRVAKMYVKEIFSGLHPDNHPKMSAFENKFQYGEMIIERDIEVHSTCEHHFLPIVGKAHIAYISSGKIIGLSKLNRIVSYYSKRPQIQERLTRQIVADLQQALETDDVACIVDARHMCVILRGVQDTGSSMLTMEFGGKFQDPQVKREFLDYLNISGREISEES